MGDELVISIPGQSCMYSKVFDLKGARIGKVIRVLGPVDNPMGVVKLISDKKRDLGDILKVEIRGE